MDSKQQFLNYLNKISNNETDILHYIEIEDEDEKIMQELRNKIKLAITENKQDLDLYLHLILKIANNHYQSSNFFEKIQQLIKELKNDIIQNFSNLEIFKIFKNNKRMVLILIEEQIIKINELKFDDYYSYELQYNKNYRYYFAPEKGRIENANDLELFKIKRKKGGNDSYLYQLIKEDSIYVFIEYINKKNISLNSEIMIGMFETNSFLNKRSHVSLIELAAFFGSIQIFNYIKAGNVRLPRSLWLFAIHSQNPEIIQILEDNNIKPIDETYEECLIESIKCHHNNITNYFLNNYIANNDKSYIHYIIKSYNFIALAEMLNNESFDLYDWTFINNIAQLKGFLIYYDFYKMNHNIADFLITNTNIAFVNIKVEGIIKNALNVAVENNDIKLVQCLISNPKIDVNTLFIDYKMKDTVLTYALKCKYFEIAKLLIQNSKIDVNFKAIKCYNEETALTISIRNNYDEITELLLMMSNIDVNTQAIHYNSIESPLIIAVKNANIKIIKLLLQKPDINVNAISKIDSNNEAALSLAIKNKNIEIIKILLAHPSINPIVFNMDESGDDSLIYLIRYNHSKILKLLLNHKNLKNNLNDSDVLPFSIYFKNSYKILLSKPNININAALILHKESGRSELLTSLNIAIYNNYMKIFKILLSYPSIDINLSYQDDQCDMQTPLCLAIKNNNIEVVNLLLDNPKIDINAISYINKTMETALTVAIKNNNIEVVNLLLLNPDIDINSNFDSNKYDKETPLNIAIKNDNIEVVKLLLNNPKIDVNAISYINDNEETALINSIKNNNIEVVKLLLNNPKIDVNAISYINDNEETALINSIKNNNIEIVKLLLNNPKIDVNVISYINGNEENALIDAIKSGNIEIVNLLLNNPKIDVNAIPRTNENRETALINAIKSDIIEITKLLLDNPKIDINAISYINKTMETALTVAIKNNNIEVVNLLLLNPDIDINSNFDSNEYDKETPLNIAIKNDNIEIIKLLLNNPKIDVNAISYINGKKETALINSIKNNNIEVVKLLLNNPKIDVNAILYINGNKETAFTFAIKCNNMEILKLFVKLYPNIDINYQSKDYYSIPIGDTLLLKAIQNNDNEFAKLLLSNSSIDINAKSRNLNENAEKINKHILYKEYLSELKYYQYYDEETPLTCALKNKNEEIINLLLKYTNIDINFTCSNNCKKETPLIIAIQNGNLEVINKLLSSSNIDVNYSPTRLRMSYAYEGQTALTAAIETNNLDVIRLLLKRTNINVNGISIYFEPFRQEKTSLYVAIEKENIEIIKLLLSHPNIDVNSLSKFIKNDDFDKRYIEKSPIHLAVEKENLEIIQLLASHPSIDINSEMISSVSKEDDRQSQKKTAFHIAIEKRNIDIIKYMLSIPKLDINAKYSIENCEFNYINKYNDLYAEVDEKYFINAAQLSEIEYQENLQKYKQQLSENFEGGPEKFFEYERLKKKCMPKEEHAHFEIKTPIFMAVENNNLEIIKHLLSNTNINTKIKAEYIETKTYINPYDLFEIRYHFNKSYKTILDVAISKGNEEIIALLRQ